MINITNDTSTLNGSLVEMKDQLLTELSNKGVTTSFDPTTGLLGLISEISNIPTGGGATVDTLTLTTNKTILSYADSETATLTVTAYDSNNDPVPNATIGLYKNNTYWDTLTTNNNGVATKTYNSAGAGDINITAVSSIALYKTINIEDCTYYWDCLSDDGHWNWNSAMTRSYSNDGVTISSTNSGSGVNICSRADITLPTNFVGEWTWMDGTQYSGELGMGGARVTHSHYSGKDTWYYYQECNTQDSSATVNVHEDWSNGDVIKVTRQNHVLNIYRNDVLKNTITRSSDYPYLELGAFHIQRTTKLKDIKIKPL